MSKAHTLVELLVALALAGTLVLLGWSGAGLLRQAYRDNRATWTSLQTIRLGEILLERDLKQLGYLLPEDLAARAWGSHLLLAGVPVTSRHPGLSLGSKPPPYYAVARRLDGACLELDTLDLDGDRRVDFVAGQGLITDGGAGLVERVAADSSKLWFRAAAGLPLACGERVVPAVHYEQRGTALWRDGQLALESLNEFGVALAARAIRIRLAAGEGPARRAIEYERQLPH